jgi:hypothetical protein
VAWPPFSEGEWSREVGSNEKWEFYLQLAPLYNKALSTQQIIMARGKFNKRGGGKKFDAVSAEEVELRNKRLEEFEEERAKRRADEGCDEEGGEAGGEKEAGKEGEGSDATEKPASAKAKPEEDEKPVIVTSAEDHRRNMRKLDAVRKRREEAEMRRLAEQATEMALEDERRLQFAAMQREDDDEEDEKTGKKKKKKEKAIIPKLTKIDIKKMKPAQMKDALKERGLEIQGNKNELTERLVKFEADR